MSTRLDLSKLSLMDALDLAKLIEMEACHRYQMFASQFGRTGGYDAGAFFATMAENEAKHGQALEARRKTLFGDAPARLTLDDLFDVEAPDMGAPRRGMSTIQAFEVGLAAEKKAYDFYDMALPGITDPEVQALFTELRDEEVEHVEMLREAMAALPESAGVEVELDLDEAPYLQGEARDLQGLPNGQKETIDTLFVELIFEHLDDLDQPSFDTRMSNLQDIRKSFHL